MEFSLEQIGWAAQQVVTKIDQSSSQDHAVLVTFSGDLGAGKTTLIKEIAKQLGVVEDLQSPTYVIYKKYSVVQIPTPTLPEGEGAELGSSWNKLVHGDMYRLESEQEILKLGWNELLADPKNILLVEWPEKIAEAIPDWGIMVTLTHKGLDVRGIDIA